MSNLMQIIRECVAESSSRSDLWIRFLNATRVEQMAEVGVYKGDFAAALLENCESIQRYYLIDPWRHLEDWNKPANESDHRFEQYLAETRAKTDFAAEKRVILRGKTTEVVERIADAALDLAYIDGDHTLRGIAIDLVRLFPKVKTGGWIGGDDFSRSVWQHSTAFEPTLVFPFAVHFAEAVGARIYALPYSQFLIEKCGMNSFAFVDLTGTYGDTGLRRQFQPDTFLKLIVAENLPFLMKAARRVKNTVSQHRKKSL
jgi:hypothetical protein